MKFMKVWISLVQLRDHHFLIALSSLVMVLRFEADNPIPDPASYFHPTISSQHDQDGMIWSIKPLSSAM